MYDLRHYKSPPRFLGYIICLLLIVSRYLSLSENAAVQSGNAVLVIVILCLCLHLMRRTAELFVDHVWRDPGALVLLVMPSVNLVVTGLGVASKPLGAVFSSTAFLILLTLISTPVFLSGYFIYTAKKFPEVYLLKLTAFGVTAVCAVYVVLRLLDKVVFPWIVAGGGTVPPRLTQLAAGNGALSLFIIILCLAAFYLMGRAVKDIPEEEDSHDA